MSRKAIIITSVITLSVGSVAFYFLYWRKRGGVSESDKSMLQQATAVELNTNVNALPDVDENTERDLKPSIVQGPIKIK